MFETTVVESKKHKVGIQRLLTLPVSIALHVIVIAAVVIGAIWTVDFPTNSPAQVAQYSVAAAPPPPPPPAAASAAQGGAGAASGQAGGHSEGHSGAGTHGGA